MRKVYICSRYAGDVLLNIKKAKRFSQQAYKEGYLPVCVHLFLNESTGLKERKDRPKLLKLGLEFIDVCDEVWVFAIDGISEGMRGEINYAREKGIKIRWR